jgi:hypothetical protein
VCRAAVGGCDQTEVCSGGSPNCPADLCAPNSGGGALGSIGVGGGGSRSGCVRPGESVGFSISFPQAGRPVNQFPSFPAGLSPGAGVPSMNVSGGAGIRMSGVPGCGGNITSYSFQDNVGPGWYVNGTPWPGASGAFGFSVTNTGGACSEASYNLNYSR